ncbi:MAG: hypothetical protein PHH48_07815 [Eubacteriales bacterium]|nr:hypothetical protein [Eubacteriales bacterium]
MMNILTVKDLIEALQKYDPDLEIWDSTELGLFPFDNRYLPSAVIIEEFDITTKDLLPDVGKKVVLF